MFPNSESSLHLIFPNPKNNAIDIWSPRNSLFVYSSIIIAFLSLCAYLYKPHTLPNEPPLSPGAWPIIGHIHLYGLDMYKFIEKTRLTFLDPFTPFSFNLFSKRLYILTSPSQIQSVYKRPSTFAFYPLMIMFQAQLFGMKASGIQLLKDKVTSSAGEGGLIASLQKTHQLMESRGAGGHLVELEARILNAIQQALTSLDRNGGKKSSLRASTRDLMWTASLAAFYGPKGFHTDNGFYDAYHVWEDNRAVLLTNPFPKLFFRKAYKARDQVVRSIQNYITSPSRLAGASKSVQARIAVVQDHGGDSSELRAQVEFGFLFGLLENAPLLVFWMMTHAFSDTILLRRIRAELGKAVVEDDQKPNEFLINLAVVKMESPVLRALYEEVLRVYSGVITTREVTEDGVSLPSKDSSAFVLQKGALVQAPVYTSHTDPLVWGSDARNFNLERFINPDRTTTAARVQAFRPFGGGRHLCPGRHLAFTEVLAFAATMLFFFDVELQGKRVPSPWVRSTGGIYHPNWDLETDIRRREGLEKATWKYV